MYLSLRLLDPLIKFHKSSVLASRDLFQKILRQAGEMTQVTNDLKLSWSPSDLLDQGDICLREEPSQLITLLLTRFYRFKKKRNTAPKTRVVEIFCSNPIPSFLIQSKMARNSRQDLNPTIPILSAMMEARFWHDAP